MIPVPFQNSIVSATLHKGQLGSAGAQLTQQLQRCFLSQLLNLVNSFTKPLIFKSNVSFPSLLPPATRETLYDLKSSLNLRGNSNSTTRFPTSCLFKLRRWAWGFQRRPERSLWRPPGIFALGSSLSYHQCEILIAAPQPLFMNGTLVYRGVNEYDCCLCLSHSRRYLSAVECMQSRFNTCSKHFE